MESLMVRIWEIEEPEAAPPQFAKDTRCEQIFNSTVTRDSDGRFSVAMPFKSDRSIDFPGMRQLAMNRLYQLECRLTKNPYLHNSYCQFMREYEKLGHLSRADGPGEYFIPHHAIHKQSGTESKLRVVFNVSARCRSGVSLNDCLMIGPKLQQDIVNVLTGFRVHKVAFTTDICKMYRQIDIVPAHRKFQHILWREVPHAPVEEFTLNTITYGVNCAPYLALRVLQFIAENDYGDLPGVNRALRHQTYMDDICVGADLVAEAKLLQQSMINILSRSGLELKKWASNAPEVFSHLNPEDSLLIHSISTEEMEYKCWA